MADARSAVKGRTALRYRTQSMLHASAAPVSVSFSIKVKKNDELIQSILLVGKCSSGYILAKDESTCVRAAGRSRARREIF